MTAPQRLAQFVQPNLHEARIAHQWAKIENAAQHRATLALPRFAPMLAASLFLCGALVFGWRWFHAAHTATLNGTIVESGASGTQALTLPDGSRIQLGSASRLVVDTYDANKVQVTLKQGSAEFEVAHQTGRQFAVFAGRFAVSVLGTHFTVSLNAASAPERVTVRVERGKVAVRNRQSAPDERVLGAGQTWSAAEEIEPVQGAAESSRPDAAADFAGGLGQEFSRCRASSLRGRRNRERRQIGSGSQRPVRGRPIVSHQRQLARVCRFVEQARDRTAPTRERGWRLSSSGECAWTFSVMPRGASKRSAMPSS